MQCVENSADDRSEIELELYFLIAKFLAAGRCTKSATVLKQELEDHKLLPKRIDWEGNEHFRSFDNLDEINQHISPEHLLKICKRIGPLLEKDGESRVRGVMSLLGAGKQSVLRTPNLKEEIRWPSTAYVAQRHGNCLVPPNNLLSQPCTVSIMNSRQLNGGCRTDQVVPGRLYSKFGLLTRSLGHLSAVYCVAFDMTGEYIVTGADDNLVKIWSATTGRLLSTLRGHAAEITDITISYDNRLLATGSCDKTVRVWCLRTTAPVAILQAHTGTITSLQFCPLVRGDVRYLVSTGVDGCVCFWQWQVSSRKFDPKPIKFVERSRAGARMLCSSFSPGGMFLATGNSDHVVRAYCFTTSVPEKVCELEGHTDTVDSIQYSNHSSRFVSGSKDGTARIWRFDRQQWKAILLNMVVTMKSGTDNDQSEQLFDSPSQSSNSKLYVTMVAWTQNDDHVVVAVSDLSLKVWNSYTGQLMRILQGHKDEVYVLENNPVDSRIFLTAGHDGNILLWDLSTGTVVKTYFNVIQGQGHGAVYDCKWAPDGQSYAATDSHGYFMYFGFGSAERYKRLPEEQYFHTDYRPLIRDGNNYVLDEQTQEAPHLMAPPFLVDIDGNPHPPRYQRLVPGRENMSDQQLVPQVIIAANGDREVLDEAVMEPSEEAVPEEAVAQNQEEQNLDIIDHMIVRMQREQDQRLADAGEELLLSPSRNGTSNLPAASGSNRQGSSSSPAAASRRLRSMSIDEFGAEEPVVNTNSNSVWGKRVVVRPLGHYVRRSREKWRHQMAEEEMRRFVLERRRKPLPPSENDSSDSSSYMKTRRRRREYQGPRSLRVEETPRNRLTTRALYDTDVEEEEEQGTAAGQEDDSVLWNEENESGCESSEYSDWTADAGMNLQPPKRQSTRPVKKKKFSSSEEDEDEEEESEREGRNRTRQSASRKKKTTPPPSPKKKETRRERNQREVLSHQAEIREVPPEYQPPEWLSDTIPRKAPYVPQLGDRVMYFRQGHQLYLEAVMKRKVYEIEIDKNQPWHKNPNLRDQELMQIIGLKYEIRPPRLVCLKLGFIDTETGKLCGGSFTIKYHDMNDVIDFLVLKQNYDTAVKRRYKVGVRFRCMIDDAWWTGTVAGIAPFNNEYPDSMFQCLKVHWDNDEVEYMSPWDLEPIDKDRLPADIRSSVPVQQQELASLMYRPKVWEWPAGGRDVACDRIARGFERIMELSIAEPFLAPVDLNAFPIYAMVIEYMIDLSTIKARLENRYYRRVTSIQYDVRYIETNARKFNEPDSHIVKYAKLIVELCLRFISDVNCTDPMVIYNELTQDVDFAIVRLTANVSSDEDDVDVGTTSTRRRLHSRKKSQSNLLDVDAWRDDCIELCREMLTADDSEPFRMPVDPTIYQDYYDVVSRPMDLSTVNDRLHNAYYEDPMCFCKDVRLVFNNSKAYNTNKKSRIFSMTLRLSAMFEDQMREIIGDWKSAKRYKKTGRLPSKYKKRRDSSPPSATPKAMLSRPSTSSGPSQTTPVAGPSRSMRSRDAGISAEKKATTNGVRQGSEHDRSRWQDGSSGEEESSGQSEQDDSDYRVRIRASRQSPKKRAPTKKKSSATVITPPETGVKRQRVKYSAGSSGDNSSNDSDAANDSDYHTRKRVCRQSPKKKITPPKKKSSASQVNGKSYSTRCATGSIKRRRYDSGPSGDESASNESNESSHEESSIQKSHVRTRLHPVAPSPAQRDSSSTSESSESCDHEVRRSQRSSRRHGPIVAASESRTDDRHASPTDRERLSTTRNQGRRTVHYHEDSPETDSRKDNGSRTSQDSETTNTSFTVSSRGRLRKLTPRAQAMLAD